MCEDEHGLRKRGFLETPRLRLLLLAYLRGLLKPDYDSGVKSQIREMLVINALVREIEGGELKNRALLDAVTLDSMKPERRPAILTTAFNLQAQSGALRMQQSYTQVRKLKKWNPDEEKSVKEMMAVLKVLKHTNFADKMRTILRS